MRKVLIGVSVVVMTVIGIAAASLASGSSRPPRDSSPALLQDYFNGPGDSNWTFYNRDGRIADGRIWIDGGYKPDAIERDGWALTHVGDRTWRDYTYDVSYDNENVGGSPPERYMVTLYFRVAAQAPNARPTTTYRLDIWAPGPFTEGGSCGSWAVGGYVGLSKYINGQGGTALAETCVSNAVVGTNEARVIVRGNTFTVFSNGSLVLSYADPTPIRYGGVGVGQIWETNGWFDNVNVSSLCKRGDHGRC